MPWYALVSDSANPYSRGEGIAFGLIFLAITVVFWIAPAVVAAAVYKYIIIKKHTDIA